jgi:hypothetical protein
MAKSARASLSVLLAALCACATPRESEVLVHYPPRLSGVKKIGIMPIGATITRIVFTGENEPVTEEQNAAIAAIGDSELTLLRARGFEAEALPLDEKLFAEQPDLRFQSTQAQKAGELAMVRMIRAKDRAAAEAATKGALNELSSVAAVSGADALLFTHFEGYVLSGGEMTKEIMKSVDFLVLTLGTFTTVAKRRGSGIAVCVIDANTGEVLYADSTDSNASRSNVPEALSKVVLEEFKR